MAIGKSQLGRAGELALSLYALVTSGGALELFSPVVDDDHVDLVAGLHGGLPRLGLQVKTSDALDAAGEVEATASYPEGAVRDDPAFVYAVLLLEGVRVEAAWLVPSPDFNRLAYRRAAAGREILEFRAAPGRDDAFARFRVAPAGIGPALVRQIDSAPPAPAWLTALAPPRDR